MTISERITLCRFLEKIEGQEAYCASIGVRDISKLCGNELAGKKMGIEKNSKQT